MRPGKKEPPRRCPHQITAGRVTRCLPVRTAVICVHLCFPNCALSARRKLTIGAQAGMQRGCSSTEQGNTDAHRYSGPRVSCGVRWRLFLIVMAAGGPPSTPLPISAPKGVDGRPSPAMRWRACRRPVSTYLQFGVVCGFGGSADHACRSAETDRDGAMQDELWGRAAGMKPS
jgi:hypothetical protein